jgi:hypothetical protein
MKIIIYQCECCGRIYTEFPNAWCCMVNKSASDIKKLTFNVQE